MILGTLGQPRSGKTLLMTYWLKLFFDAGYEIVSNYPLNFKYWPFDIDVIDKLINDESFLKKWGSFRGYYGAKRMVIAIDEISVIMESRQAMRKENILLSYLLMQSGKQDVNVIWSAQLPHSVDKRLRDLTEFITFAEKQKDSEKKIIGFKYSMLDMFNVTKKTFFLREEQAQKIYKLYDTTAPIYRVALKK